MSALSIVRKGSEMLEGRIAVINWNSLHPRSLAGLLLGACLAVPAHSKCHSIFFIGATAATLNVWAFGMERKGRLFEVHLKRGVMSG